MHTVSEDFRQADVDQQSLFEPLLLILRFVSKIRVSAQQKRANPLTEARNDLGRSPMRTVLRISKHHYRAL